MAQNAATKMSHHDHRSSLVPDCLRLTIKWLACSIVSVVSLLIAAATASAGEADLAIPDLRKGQFPTLGGISAWNLLFYGAWVIVGTLGISLYQLYQIKKQPAHKSMLDVAEIIFQTCKTYLIQQGKFLLMLFVLIAIAISYYLMNTGEHVTETATGDAVAAATDHAPEGPSMSKPVIVALVLLFSIVGMAGSYAVAWYGIRVNTYANSRTAFASLRGQPWDVVNIPLRAG